MKLTAHPGHALSGTPQWQNGDPLWKLVPKRDDEGRAYVDFMMLAPGLNKRTHGEIDAVVTLARGVLEGFGDAVVFANFNLSLNVLWVSLCNQPGLMSEVVYLLRARVPMFRLVAHNPHAGRQRRPHTPAGQAG